MVIFKFVGIFLILSSGFLIGKRLSELLTKKSDMLLEAQNFLEQLRASFLYRESSVVESFCEILSSSSYRYFDMRLNEIKPQSYKSDLNRCLLASNNVTYLLNKEQKIVLRDALIKIGEGTKLEEADRLLYFIKYFETQENKSREYESKNKKLFLAVSVYASIVLSVLFL